MAGGHSARRPPALVLGLVQNDALALVETAIEAS